MEKDKKQLEELEIIYPEMIDPMIDQIRNDILREFEEIESNFDTLSLIDIKNISPKRFENIITSETVNFYNGNNLHDDIDNENAEYVLDYLDDMKDFVTEISEEFKNVKFFISPESDYDSTRIDGNILSAKYYVTYKSILSEDAYKKHIESIVRHEFRTKFSEFIYNMLILSNNKVKSFRITVPCETIKMYQEGLITAEGVARLTYGGCSI